MKDLADLAQSKKYIYSTTVTFITETLRDAIVRGIFKSGEKLRQDIIANELGTSAIPVREAFNILESQGLIKRIPNRGVFVSELSIKDVEEIYELRVLLETKAIRLALPHISDAGLQNAEDLILEADRTDDPHRKSDLNWQFHTYLYGLSGRHRLVKLIKDIHYSVQHYIRLYTTIAGEDKVSGTDHRILLEKIARRDEEEVRRFLEDHLCTARDMLIRHFENKQKEKID